MSFILKYDTEFTDLGQIIRDKFPKNGRKQPINFSVFDFPVCADAVAKSVQTHFVSTGRQDKITVNTRYHVESNNGYIYIYRRREVSQESAITSTKGTSQLWNYN